MSWTPKVQNIGDVFITSGGQTESKWTPNSDQINDPFYTQGSGAAPEVTLDGVTTIQFDKVILLPTGSQPRVVNTGTPNHAVLTLYLPLTSGEAGNSAPIASENIAGLIRVGRSLKIDDEAVLEVNTADRVEKDNTLPITSQAVNEKIQGIAKALSEDVATKAPTNHASNENTYGTGNTNAYGHVKLSASTSDTAGADDGIAATPSAVKSAYDLANNAMLGLDGLRESLDERLDQAGMVPTNHASSDTAYGKGDGTSYGHVKLSASTSSTSGVSDGIAATPSAVKSAYDLANNATLGLDGLRESLYERLDQTDNNVDVLTNLVEEHVLDKNNPHSVTAGQIGAAPAGLNVGNYVLDTDAAVNEILYNLIKNPDFTGGQVQNISIYASGSSMTLTGGHRHFIELRKSTNDYGVITATSYHSGGPRIMMRQWYGGTLGEWEWVNPPMDVGVEYRTTKRWNGKAVYTKLINFINSAAIGGTSSVYIPHGISNLDFMLKAEVTTSGYFIPYVSSDTSLVISAWNGTNLVVYNGGSSWAANRTWYVTIEYTKK